jgi:anion-transporting  ArsA/GET3 family ATPase
MTPISLDTAARGQAVLVMGKGGVGKTTVAAALAVLEVERRGRAVLVEFGDGASGRRALGAAKGVTHIVVQPDEALRIGAAPLFGSAVVARLVLDNFAVRPLLRAAPAIQEIVMLESVRQIVEQHRGVRVFVDMPATGYSVAWLRTARQGRDFLGAGPLFELCDRVARELVAPGRAVPIIVTLPELLVLEETRELGTALTQELGLTVAAIVVNRVPQGFGADVLGLTRGLIAQAAPPLAAMLTPLAALLSARAALSAEANQAVAAFSAGATAIWRLPLAAVDPTAQEVAAWLDTAGAA